MSASLSGSGLILPFSELSFRGICSPADGGCALEDRGGSVLFSRGGASEDNIVPDFRLIAFWIGLCFTLASGPALLGVAAFLLLDFLDLPVAGSVKDISSPPMSTSALGSSGDVAFELGAVLGFV